MLMQALGVSAGRVYGDRLACYVEFAQPSSIQRSHTQASVCSAISNASSISIPKYRTVLSSLV